MSDCSVKGDLSASASLTFRGSATISATFSGTGRYVVCDNDYGIVSGWVQRTERAALLAHGACQQFRDALSGIGTLDEAMLQCWRGRTPPFRRRAPAGKEMGPPSRDRAQGSRYNRKGHSVLYLSDSLEGVKRELAERTGPVWVQRFKVPSGSMRIADFRSSVHRATFVAAVLWFAELSGQSGYPDLRFSQTVGELVGERFDGMMVPGVRGDMEATYNNVVIFQPGTAWKAWLDGSDPFELT